MADLIDRAALKDALAKRVPYAVVTSDDAAFAYGLDAAYVAVQDAPAVDAVEVVRCRDCIHAKPIPAARRRDYFDPDGLRHCALMRTEADVYGVCALQEDCYCDEGERKDADATERAGKERENG